MRKDSSEKLTGNAQFEGYSVDLIYEISRLLGFNYTFRLVPDGRYGSYNPQTKEWDGMMKELLEQKADLAIGDLTITYDREQVVDFTTPFMPLGESQRYECSKYRCNFTIHINMLYERSCKKNMPFYINSLR